MDKNRNKKTTSWDNVSHWYDKMLSDEDSYQQKVIKPNLLRILNIQKDNITSERVLDLGCGQGFFSEVIAEAGAYVEGVDISPELIKIAKKNSSVRGIKNINYVVGSVSAPLSFKDRYFDKVVSVLAMQNIKDASFAISECVRVLKEKGSLVVVLNHPVFRVPKGKGGGSDWGYDTKTGEQYRKVYEYLSEKNVEIVMNPGEVARGKKSVNTYSFHRPLQLYFKMFAKSGLAVTRLEEWISHKESEKGPKKEWEDKARKEIPLFMMLEAKEI